MTRRLLFMLCALATLLAPHAARAQFLPEAGPSREQQEFAETVLLGPEASVLGAFLVGGGTFLVEKNCCTAKGKDPAVTPVAIGAGVGAAIGAGWAQWSISNHFHPGSRLNSAIGAAIGGAAGSAIYFGGPANEKSNDQILRVVAFLFLPSLCAYGGWHVGGEDGFFDASAASPPPVWNDHLWNGAPRASAPLVAQTVSLRF